ncbi:MAG: hypothetical protein HQL32_04800 [Planctomycetes bacterium]|nr:hypothetical protein [Planctomycetota bacterium]
MSGAGVEGIVTADFARSYSPDHTSYGRISASVDIIQASLASNAVQVSTEAMHTQFSSFNFFDSKA